MPSTPKTLPRTLFDKIWDAHCVMTRDDGQSLLYIDRHYVHEGSFQAFDQVWEKGLPIHRPGQTFGVPDHYVPTADAPPGGKRVDAATGPDIRRMIDLFDANMARAGLPSVGLDDPRQGIVHVVGPEQGLTLPGMTIVCGDSHTSTHGALGALAFGIGASEVAHVLATQTLWQVKPKSMRISVDGQFGAGVTAKDLILAIIAEISAGGALGYVVEYGGSAVRSLSVEGRLTLCNMSIEAGARAGMVAPDQKTLDYVKGRPHAPTGADWDKAAAAWMALASDTGAAFDREVTLDGTKLAPMVTWGTSPEAAVPVTGRVPDPSTARDAAHAQAITESLDYMGLTAGTAMTDIAVDQVFIGSCTNSRIEDLRAAAAIAKKGRARVPALVSPGSTPVKVAAEAEGLDRIFKEAGFIWAQSGCSMCVGMNGDLVASGKRVASTSNRNFPGRQGKGARTHLVSPAMAAAAALAGHFVDVREV